MVGGSLMDVQYPMWLPQEAWREYLKMRKRIKKPLTEYGEKIALNKLERLKTAGHDPQTVLDNSIFNSWAGVFEPKAMEAAMTPVEVKKTIPGYCKVCGGGKKTVAEGFECKRCGNKTKTLEE
jgi:hypothetical protein